MYSRFTVDFGVIPATFLYRAIVFTMIQSIPLSGSPLQDSFLSNGGPFSSDEGASFPLDVSPFSGPSPPKRKRTELTVSAKLDLIDRYRRLDVKSRRQAAALLNVSHGFLNQVRRGKAFKEEYR